MTEPDIERRIELERADAARTAIDRVIKKLEGAAVLYRSESYRKAWKAAVECIRGEPAVNSLDIDKSRGKI